MSEWVERLQFFDQVLKLRIEDFGARLTQCQDLIASLAKDPSQAPEVKVSEVDKASVEVEALTKYMCDYVTSDAKLESFFTYVFGKGWLNLADFKGGNNLVVKELKDSTGKTKPNGILFHGWKLSFDQSKITLFDLISGRNDARLKAWAFAHKEKVTGADKCLPKKPGEWNP
jgi:hypothetical protein